MIGFPGILFCNMCRSHHHRSKLSKAVSVLLIAGQLVWGLPVGSSSAAYGSETLRPSIEGTLPGLEEALISSAGLEEMGKINLNWTDFIDLQALIEYIRQKSSDDPELAGLRSFQHAEMAKKIIANRQEEGPFRGELWGISAQKVFQQRSILMFY